jgi:Uncharacterized conserved protein
MEEVTYAFIDGNYLRNVYEQTLKPFFLGEGDLDFGELKRNVSARKAFYYDCMDKLPRGGELPDVLARRIEAQEWLFNEIRSLDGYHVRLGTLSGSDKGKRQKEVDVLLAVDMLSHAFHRNMTRAVLVAGDLDFRPVVDSLIQFGTYVQVFYEPRSGAKELGWAADFGAKITLPTLYSWSSELFRKGHPLPIQTLQAQGPIPPGHRLVAEGTFSGRRIVLVGVATKYQIIDALWSPHQMLIVEYHDVEKLKHFWSQEYGEVSWRVSS